MAARKEMVMIKKVGTLAWWVLAGGGMERHLVLSLSHPKQHEFCELFLHDEQGDSDISFLRSPMWISEGNWV